MRGVRHRHLATGHLARLAGRFFLKVKKPCLYGSVILTVSKIQILLDIESCARACFTDAPDIEHCIYCKIFFEITFFHASLVGVALSHLLFFVEEDNAATRASLDTFVRSQAQASPYHLSAWRAAIHAAYGHESRVLVARTDGDIHGCLAYSIVKRPVGKACWSALPFCDIGGPLAATTELRDALELEAARAAARAGAAGFESRGSAATMQPESDLAGRKVRMLLALPDNAEALMQAYPPKLRSQIRKAGKNGLDCAIEAGPDAIAAFYDVYSRNMSRLGSPPHSRLWFEAICRYYGDDALLAIVRHQGKAVGAGLVLRCGARAAIPWASTLSEYNHLAPNMLLYWTIQERLCSLGVREFDFGRSTHGEGTYRFKKQWGAYPLALDWRAFNAAGQPVTPDPGAGHAQGSLRRLVEKTWQKLPLEMANTLGPRLRRYITL